MSEQPVSVVKKGKSGNPDLVVVNNLIKHCLLSV